MKFDTILWKKRRKENKAERKSLVDIVLYPLGLIFDFLDCWRLK